jgi:hypothetical protein
MKREGAREGMRLAICIPRQGTTPWSSAGWGCSRRHLTIVVRGVAFLGVDEHPLGEDPREEGP